MIPLNASFLLLIHLLSPSALLSLLGTSAAVLRPGDDTNAKETRYTELTMKCLWKLAKTVQENLRTGVLNPDELLFDINKFFITTPPTEWKRRAAESVPLGEMPLRTVKTLLLELVNGLGDSIFQHLTLIDNPQASSVYPYLHHMLEACRKRERMQQVRQSPYATMPQTGSENPRFSAHSRTSSLSRPSSISSLKSNGMARTTSIGSYLSGEQPMDTGAASGGHPADMTIPVAAPMHQQTNRLSTPSPVSHNVQPMQVDDEPMQTDRTLSDYEMNQLLTQIFHKIGTRDQTKQGIIELYEFQKKYPLAEAKVNTYLSQSGQYFQSYIRRGLSNLAAEDTDLRSQQAQSSPVAMHTTTTTANAMTTTTTSMASVPVSNLPAATASMTTAPIGSTTAAASSSSSPSSPPPQPPAATTINTTTTTTTTDYSSHHSSPRNSSPPISSPVLQEQQQRQSTDLSRTSSMSGYRSSMHAGKVHCTIPPTLCIQTHYCRY